LGNKLDCEPRAVSQEIAQEYCDKKGIKFFEVSAKDGTNVLEAFNAMTRLCMSKNPKVEK
jgi:hypothetical protein